MKQACGWLVDRFGLRVPWLSHAPAGSTSPADGAGDIRRRSVRPPHRPPVLRVRVMMLAAVAAAAAPACRHSLEPSDPGDASYSVGLEPPPIIYATAACDRYLSYAILSLGRRLHGFGLSINIINDCTRGGGGWTYGEVYIRGRYATADTLLTLTPDDPSTPPFAGTFDSLYVRLALPARTDSLAAAPIPLELGPRMPF